MKRWFSLIYKKKYGLSLPGCAKSWQSYEIYKKNELNNMKMIKLICYFMIFFTVALCGTTGCIPVVYLLFEFPNEWITALPTK